MTAIGILVPYSSCERTRYPHPLRIQFATTISYSTAQVGAGTHNVRTEHRINRTLHPHRTRPLCLGRSADSAPSRK